LGANEDIGVTVSGQMVLLERFDKLFESRSRGDILVGIDVQLLGCAVGQQSGDADLIPDGNFGKFHIFFDAESPASDSAKRSFASVEYVGFWNFKGHFRFVWCVRFVRFFGFFWFFWFVGWVHSLFGLPLEHLFRLPLGRVDSLKTVCVDCLGGDSEST